MSEEVRKNLEKDRLFAHQARLAAMGEMLRDIAHQWRQPLNNIAVVLQSLQIEHEAGELDSATCRNMVGTCFDALKYLSRTIDEFRTFYQPDREQAPFDFREAVEAAIHLVRLSIESCGIELRYSGTGTTTLCGYRNEFVNTVMNILNNAKDAILEHPTERPFIDVKTRFEDGAAILAIRDTGGGIPQEIADKIFDPYFTTKFKSQGTGIGLYMARTLIETTMGGNIAVRNHDTGAEFIITISCVQTRHPQAPAPSGPSPDNPPF